MKLTSDGRPDGVEALAEQAVVAVCTLADAADPMRWSASAVEDAAAALEVLASALARLDPECAEILTVVPIAAAAVLERAEQARAETGPGETAHGRDTSGTTTALRQALTAHGITQHRVHQLGAALITVTLEPADAQALAVLLTPRTDIPHQKPPADPNSGWGEGPAKTASAVLAQALAQHGAGSYARVLSAGQVSAGLSPRTAQCVIAALNDRATPTSHGRRRGLGHRYKGIGTR